MSRNISIYPILALLIFTIEQFFFVTRIVDWRICYYALGFLLFIRYGIGDRNIFRNIALLAVVVTVVSNLHAVLVGNISLYTAVKNEVFQAFILLYLPMSAMIKKKGLGRTEDTVVLMALLLSIILLGLSLGNVTLANYSASERDYGVRAIIGPTLLSWAVLIIIHRGLSMRNMSPVMVASLFVIALSLVFVVQTRSQTISVVISVLFMFIMHKKSREKRNKDNRRSLFLSLCMIMVATYYILTYVNSEISQSIDRGEASSVNRLASYTYYYDLLRQNLLWGIGVTEGELNQANLYGVYMMWYDADIGVVGVISKYGIFSVLFLIMFGIKIFKVLQKSHNPLYSAMALQMLVLLPFNCPFNSPEATFYFALYISMLEILSYKYEKTKNYTLDTICQSRRL